MRRLAFFLVLFSLLNFLLALHLTREKIGEAFPGYLTFKNGVVGPFYVPGWTGPEEGMIYHRLAPPGSPISEDRQVFSERDYLLIVGLPAVSGLLFVLLGSGLSLYLGRGAGRFPLLLFHFLVGNYLILSPEFHLTHRFSEVLLIFFAFIPAPMIHFAFLFPERDRRFTERSLWWMVPYGASLLFLIPYLIFFRRDPALWVRWEYVMVAYVVAAYLFWCGRLVLTLRRPQFEFPRIIARYLLLGQVVAFVVPLLAACLIFVAGIPFPMNLASPLTLLFPLALFMGVILARLRESQIRLVQSEKRAALGTLLAALAHELNNPMTFVYSNIEPLRESITMLKELTANGERFPSEVSGESTASQMGGAGWRVGSPPAILILEDLERLTNNLDEGATRAKEILDNFRHFSRQETRVEDAVDLRKILDQSLVLLQPKWRNRIAIQKNYGDIPAVRGSSGELSQVFVNLIANACEAIAGEGSVEITTHRDQGEVVVRIRDSGCGIFRQDLARIFDPFFTTKSPGEGTGLGLAISLEIIKNHKGLIEVKSEEGKGSEFVIKIPVS